MGLRTLGRRITVSAGRAVGMRARKYVAPLLPGLLTPLALGAGLSAGALAFFFNIADDIRQQDGVWRFDHDGLRLGLTLRNPRRTLLMRGASALARPDIMSGLGIVGLAVSHFIPAFRARGILLAVTLAGGGAIIGGIKHRFARERPSVIEALATEGTFSFPSGHSFISLCFYGILASCGFARVRTGYDARWWVSAPRRRFCSSERAACTWVSTTPPMCWQATPPRFPG